MPPTCRFESRRLPGLQQSPPHIESSTLQKAVLPPSRSLQLAGVRTSFAPTRSPTDLVILQTSNWWNFLRGENCAKLFNDPAIYCGWACAAQACIAGALLDSSRKEGNIGVGRTASPGGAALCGVRVAMSTTFSDIHPNAESKIVQQPAVASDVVEANYPIWSVLGIMFGALGSLAWTGFLVWAVGKIILGLW
jgi:hypothetical protein